jgi:hypothetical protein
VNMKPKFLEKTKSSENKKYCIHFEQTCIEVGGVAWIKGGHVQVIKVEFLKNVKNPVFLLNFFLFIYLYGHCPQDRLKYSFQHIVVLTFRQRKLLCRNGGKELSKAVKKIMECCVTAKTASQYTLLGRKKSRGNFSSLRLYRVIQRKFYTYTTMNLLDLRFRGFGCVTKQIWTCSRA